MSERREHLRLPILGIIASTAGALVLVLATDPTDKPMFSLLFFGLALVFLASLGHFLAYLRWGQLSPKGRSRIFIISSLVVVGLMLRSSGSLNWLEVLVLILIGAGLWFYSGRRAE